MLPTSLHPAQLFHIGVVAADIDQAMTEMTRTLGVTWKCGRPSEMELCIFGEDRIVEMRIAHSVEGPPHLELIQAVPNSPWAEPAAPGVHHLCYWSETPGEICSRLEAAGNQRALGKAGAASGYFRTPSGMYVEIIGPELHAQLSGWLRGEPARL